MKKRLLVGLATGLFIIGITGMANATLINLGAGSFTPAASVITFSEQPTRTVNPVYNFPTYTVSFGGYFNGGLGTTTSGVSLGFDSSAPDTFITKDSSNPTSPVLSGTPTFNGDSASIYDDLIIFILC